MREMKADEYIYLLEEQLKQKQRQFNDFYYDVLEAYGFDMTDPPETSPSPNHICDMIRELNEECQLMTINFRGLKEENDKLCAVVQKQSESLKKQVVSMQLQSEFEGFKTQVCDIFSLEYDEEKGIDSIRLLEYLVDIVEVRKRIDERFKALQDKTRRANVEIDALFSAMVKDHPGVLKCSDPAGIVSQINNMVAGMSFDLAAAEKELKEFKDLKESYDIFKLNDNLGALLKRLEDSERARDEAVREKDNIINKMMNIISHSK